MAGEYKESLPIVATECRAHDGEIHFHDMDYYAQAHS